MKNIKYFLLGALFFILNTCFVSCIDNNVKQKKNEATKIHFTINDSVLVMYNPFGIEPASNREGFDYTVISYLDVSCSVCIAEIDKWSFFYDSRTITKPFIQLIFSSKDKFEYIRFLCETNAIKRFPFPFYLDTTGNFAIKNPIFKEHSTDKTILIDKNNIVIETGNPLHSDSVRAKYIRTLK